VTGLGKLNQAEEYLAQAEWTALKTPGCEDHIKSRLYRNLGLLNAAKGNFTEALTFFSDDVSAICCIICCIFNCMVLFMVCLFVCLFDLFVCLFVCLFLC